MASLSLASTSGYQHSRSPAFKEFTQREIDGASRPRGKATLLRDGPETGVRPSIVDVRVQRLICQELTRPIRPLKPIEQV